MYFNCDLKCLTMAFTHELPEAKCRLMRASLSIEQMQHSHSQMRNQFHQTRLKFLKLLNIHNDVYELMKDSACQRFHKGNPGIKQLQCFAVTL